MRLVITSISLLFVLALMGFAAAALALGGGSPEHFDWQNLYVLPYELESHGRWLYGLDLIFGSKPWCPDGPRGDNVNGTVDLLLVGGQMIASVCVLIGLVAWSYIVVIRWYVGDRSIPLVWGLVALPPVARTLGSIVSSYDARELFVASVAIIVMSVVLLVAGTGVKSWQPR